MSCACSNGPNASTDLRHAFAHDLVAGTTYKLYAPRGRYMAYLTSNSAAPAPSGTAIFIPYAGATSTRIAAGQPTSVEIFGRFTLTADAAGGRIEFVPMHNPVG